MSENNSGPHLPPPAFPPGIRRHALNATDGVGAEASLRVEVSAAREPSSDGVPLISPDDPLPPRPDPARDPVDGALISPDEPLPRRPPGSASASSSPGDGFSEWPEGADSPDGGRGASAPNGIAGSMEEGIATGLNDDPHPHVPRVTAPSDPHVTALLESLNGLTDALKAGGGAGLRIAPQMSAFDQTLRAFCAGYLAARRDGGGSQPT
jgi:hypothetical protein